MSDRTTTKDGADDGDVSPMEAQNTGPAKAGPTEPPLRQEKPGEPTGRSDAPATPMKPGGETSTRDDL